MTAHRGLEREVRSWLREDGHEDADRVLFTVLDQLDTIPQRHPGWLARNFPVMNSAPIRYGVAAAVIAVAALLGATFLQRNSGGPVPTPPPSPQPLAGTTSLAPGTYFVHEQFPMRITFEVPSEGWQNYAWEGGVAGANTRAICTTGDNCAPPGVGVGFHLVTGVPSEPCNPGLGEVDLGDSTDDLAAAVADRPGWTSTEPEPMTVSGFPATYVEIRADPGAVDGCPGTVYAYFAGSFGRGATVGERLRLWVVDVEGTRLVVEAFDFAASSEEDVQAATQIVESLRIQAD